MAFDSVDTLKFEIERLWGAEKTMARKEELPRARELKAPERERMIGGEMDKRPSARETDTAKLAAG